LSISPSVSFKTHANIKTVLVFANLMQTYL